MRSLMISITVIMFCFSINIINLMDADYKSNPAIGRSLFGWSVTPPLTPNSSEFGQLQEDNMRGTFANYTEVREQNIASNFIDTVFGTFIFVFNAVKTIINLFILPVLNFGGFIQDLGGQSVVLIPNYIALVITIGIDMNHLFAVFQLLSNRNLKGYA